MFVAMNMDESKRREWELFNCTQKDLGKITGESASRWEYKDNEMDDLDQESSVNRCNLAEQPTTGVWVPFAKVR